VSGILVIAEQRRGELRPVSLELISAAQSLRRDGDQVTVAVLGQEPGRFVPALSAAGVDRHATPSAVAPDVYPRLFNAVVSGAFKSHLGRGPV